MITTYNTIKIFVLGFFLLACISFTPQIQAFGGGGGGGGGGAGDAGVGIGVGVGDAGGSVASGVGDAGGSVASGVGGDSGGSADSGTGIGAGGTGTGGTGTGTGGTGTGTGGTGTGTGGTGTGTGTGGATSGSGGLSSSGGGSGSAVPRCVLTLSNTHIALGDSTTLSWENTRVSNAILKDSQGNTYVDTRTSTRYNETKDSITIRPTRSTTYTLEVLRNSFKRTCQVSVIVGGSGVISLSSVPYTGVGDNSFLVKTFYALAVVWITTLGLVLYARRREVTVEVK